MTHKVPALATKRLLLQPLTADSAVGYEKYFVDYEVIRHLSAAVPWPYPRDGVEKFLNTFILPNQGTDRWTWGLFLKANPSELIGCIDLWREGRPEHRGFWLGKPFWGQGLMTEAAFAVTGFAFRELGFEKLVFSNALGNVRSRRVKEKTGARLLGVQPAKLVDPSVTESEIWELTKSEWTQWEAAYQIKL